MIQPDTITVSIPASRDKFVAGKWTAWRANPLRVTVRAPDGGDFTGITEIRAELHGQRLTMGQTPLAVAQLTGPEGSTASVEFSAGKMNQDLGTAERRTFYLLLRAIRTDGNPDVFQLGTIDLVAHPASDIVSNPPEVEIWATSALVAQERAERIAALAAVPSTGDLAALAGQTTDLALAQTAAVARIADVEAGQTAAAGQIDALSASLPAKADTNLLNASPHSVDSRLIAPESVNLDHLAPSLRSTISGSGLDHTKAQGIWNAATNTPAIPAAAPENNGYWYYVTVPGTRPPGGTVTGTFAVADRVRSNGTAWEKYDAPPTIIPDDSLPLRKLQGALIHPSGMVTVAPGVKKKALWGMKIKKPGGGNAAVLMQDPTGKLWPNQTAEVEAALSALSTATGVSISAIISRLAGLDAITSGWRIMTDKGVTINGVWHPLKWAITAANYTKVLFGYTKTGIRIPLDPPPPDPDPDPEPGTGNYTEPDCVLYPGTGGGLRALTAAGESIIINDGRTYSAIQHRNGSKWLAAVAGALCIVNVAARAVIPQLSLDMLPNIIQHFGWNGQSLALGTASNPVLSAVSVYPAHSLMFNAGSQAGSASIPLNGSSLTSFVPLVETFNAVNGSYESPLSGMANRFIATVDAAFGVRPTLIQSNHAHGGQRLANISKGDQPYTNALTEFARAHAIAAAQGKGHVVPAIVMEHGQADEASSTGAVLYESLLRQLRTDYDTDIKTITGQLQDVYILINQNSSWNHYRKLHPGASIGQWRASLNDPFIICYGPEYHLPFKADGVHVTGVSSYRTGEYAAKAWFYTVHRGKKFQPLQPVSVSQVGGEVLVEFNNEYPLAWDTTIVSANTDYGFEVTGANITGTPIIDGNTVRIPVDGLATAVAYAYTAVLGPPDGSGNPTDTDGGPITGPRGNLRQSNPEVSLRDGHPLYDWCVHFPPLPL